MLLVVTLVFVGFLLAYWVLAYILIYHMTRFGIGTLPKRVSAVFLLGSFLLIALVVSALASVNFDKLWL
jgi:hypothetical protein